MPSASYVAALAFLPWSARADCLGLMAPTKFYDMHDGDEKVITAHGFDFQIHSANTSEGWDVYGTFDMNCAATVNFRVPRKPNPPPVNLTMTMYIMSDQENKYFRNGFEFTDPSGTLAPPTQPLNFWVQEAWPKPPLSESNEAKRTTCINTPLFKRAVFDDMHDGDMKSLKVNGDSLDIIPYGNKESWKVDAKFGDDCITNVDFNVKGKPNPPPVPLKAQVWPMLSIGGVNKKSVLFTDPSGTIADQKKILNAWIGEASTASTLV